MDARSYEAISEVVSEFECYVTPKPKEDENVPSFAVVSEEGRVFAEVILNALSRAAQERDDLPKARIVGTQMDRLVFEDWDELAL